MAGRMFELLTILATLAGLAFAQEPTLTGTSSSLHMDMTTTRTNSTGVLSTSRLTITVTPVVGYTASNTSHYHHSSSSSSSSSNDNNNKVTTAPKTTTFHPTASASHPVPNAGRRPTQPGLRKLTIVVGLATYGLILL
ncbi:hypothetical protein E4U55_006013 [Claviceps digitariae]|nr:hypothetical protein E4U55_006013 [Claviceps digitariae]